MHLPCGVPRDPEPGAYQGYAFEAYMFIPKYEIAVYESGAKGSVFLKTRLDLLLSCRGDRLQKNGMSSLPFQRAKEFSEILWEKHGQRPFCRDLWLLERRQVDAPGGARPTRSRDGGGAGPPHRQARVG